MLYWQIELVVPSKIIVALIGVQQINLVVVSGEPSKIIVALIGIQQINLVVVSILPSKIIVAFIGVTSNSFIYDVFKIE